MLNLGKSQSIIIIRCEISTEYSYSDAKSLFSNVYVILTSMCFWCDFCFVQEYVNV